MWDREGSGLPKANGFVKHRSCEDKLGKCALPELVKTWEWGWGEEADQGLLGLVSGVLVVIPFMGDLRIS